MTDAEWVVEQALMASENHTVTRWVMTQAIYDALREALSAADRRVPEWSPTVQLIGRPIRISNGSRIYRGEIPLTMPSGNVT